jgi:spore germination protein YaaH
MVTNLIDGNWDRELVARVLASPDDRARHIRNLVGLTVEGDYPGLELDYEELAAEDREQLTDFIAELAAVLHEQDKVLSLALHAKLSEPGEAAGARAQDWAQLGQAADRLVIMTYDHDPSRRGPIAPIAWTESVLRLALSKIQSSRVLQGIPFYGYDWGSTGDREYRTHFEVLALARAHGSPVERDPIDKHLTLRYSEQAVAHEVWIPDGITVEQLAEVGRRVGVGGYAIWRLGGEDPGVWDVIARLQG